jgi:hypothetical protein
MLAKKPNAIHFSGHGTKEALILENNNASAVPIGKEEL